MNLLENNIIVKEKDINVYTRNGTNVLETIEVHNVVLDKIK